jgi:hypothetical protein
MNIKKEKNKKDRPEGTGQTTHSKHLKNDQNIPLLLQVRIMLTMRQEEAGVNWKVQVGVLNS